MTQEDAVASVSPKNALSPRAMLSMAMHAQPGVYALLLGSGISTSAGIPTGWGVVKSLVSKLATAENPDDSESHVLAAEDPEAWWSTHAGSELGYSSLLAEAAPSASARQELLREYFVATEEEREEGNKVPGPAHTAVAELVKRGTVRVILTTNFDQLIEQALDAAGVETQVISRADALKGMTPLAHAAVTVIKLHGDYTELDTRNTLDELTTYPEQWMDLLHQVFTEFGLVISGWSGEWDKALVAALEAAPRRYPLYWDSRSAKGHGARQLPTALHGHQVPASSADQLFSELASSIDALDRLAGTTTDNRDGGCTFEAISTEPRAADRSSRPGDEQGRHCKHRDSSNPLSQCSQFRATRRTLHRIADGYDPVASSLGHRSPPRRRLAHTALGRCPPAPARSQADSHRQSDPSPAPALPCATGPADHEPGCCRARPGRSVHRAAHRAEVGRCRPGADTLLRRPASAACS
ncbi:SIR2 family protein [Rhodococcus sp. BGS-1C]|jgi:NAD-dependent SIR2 family protein deacetylase